MLARFIVQALFLDLATLVHGLHRAQNAAAFGEPFELLVDRFFHQIGQLIDGERTLQRVLDSCSDPAPC